MRALLLTAGALSFCLLAAAQKPPDEEESLPPRLKRGAPSPKDERGRPSPELEPIPSPRPKPGDEIVTDEEGRVIERRAAGAPQEAPQEEASDLDLARRLAWEFSQKMPDFICEQHTSRYTTEERPVKWKLRDRVSVELAVENGKESYRNVRVNGKPLRKGSPQESGSWSTGEFVTIQLDVLSSNTDARFKYRTASDIAGRRAKVYDYTVEKPNSHWKVDFDGNVIYPAYRGSICLDEAGGRILRIEMISRKLPSDYPMSAVEMTVDYGLVRIAGNEHILPVRAENLACKRYSLYCSRNEIEFRNYRRFTTESNVMTTDSSVTFEGEEKQPAKYEPPVISEPDTPRKKK